MGEYLKVDGHRDLVRDTRTGAILNNNKNAYLSYRKRVQEAQKQRDEIRTATREINNIKSEMHEIKSLLEKLVSKE